jgi:CheY-like chemotaxis protein
MCIKQPTSPSSAPVVLILVVDDEAIIRELICDVLESEGFLTEAKENADLAMEFLTLRSSEVALLLTDINMPGSMNGAALAHLSAHSWPTIPIVAMSGLESPESAGLGKDVMFMRKPFSLEKVLGCVQLALLERRV